MANQGERYDYIVVGSGSAGAIVAARLTEDPSVRVLLLEAGPEDRSYWSRIPLGFGKIIFDKRYMWWNHMTDPEPHLNGKQYPLPHGKVVGGSSSINGLVHVRGARLDYDTWRDRGADGWGYEDVLPYFKKYEWDSRGENEYHGGSGPIGVELARWKNPLADAFIAAAEANGIPRNTDFNGAEMYGTGYWDLMAWNVRRSSTSLAYIAPNRHRPNLRVLTEAFVTRIEFEGRTAVGVVYERGGEVHRARADREIILSAGALQTPQLLQVSGVGPGALLQELGIPVVHDLPGVGENLMDHVQVGRKYKTSSPHTLNKKVGSLFSQILAGINYYLGPRNGPLKGQIIEEIEPGPRGDNDEDLLAYIRETADTGFHFCGTARMGKDDMAVVDPALRVRGVNRLRVIDASVMPTIVSGNINAAVLMIGEKGADLVKAG